MSERVTKKQVERQAEVFAGYCRKFGILAEGESLELQRENTVGLSWRLFLTVPTDTGLYSPPILANDFLGSTTREARDALYLVNSILQGLVDHARRDADRYGAESGVIRFDPDLNPWETDEDRAAEK